MYEKEAYRAKLHPFPRRNQHLLFPLSSPPQLFSFHIVKGPLPPLLTPLLLHSNASKPIKDLDLYMETTSLQNNMNLMRK